MTAPSKPCSKCHTLLRDPGFEVDGGIGHDLVRCLAVVIGQRDEAKAAGYTECQTDVSAMLRDVYLALGAALAQAVKEKRLTRSDGEGAAQWRAITVIGDMLTALKEKQHIGYNDAALERLRGGRG